MDVDMGMNLATGVATLLRERSAALTESQVAKRSGLIAGKGLYGKV